jgi:hypothetical protein
MLGPELVLGVGLGLVFVLIFLVGLTKVSNNDVGVGLQPGQHRAAGRRVDRAGGHRHRGLERGGQQPAIPGRRGGQGSRARAARAAALQTRIYHDALATGFSRGYLISVGVLVLAAISALAAIRIRRQDLSGADPMSEPAGDACSPNLA